MSAFPDLRGRDRAGLAEIFRHYGEVEAPRLDAPTYAAISLGIAQDRERLDLAA